MADQIIGGLIADHYHIALVSPSVSIPVKAEKHRAEAYEYFYKTVAWFSVFSGIKLVDMTSRKAVFEDGSYISLSICEKTCMDDLAEKT